MNCYHLHAAATVYSLRSNGREPPLFLMFGHKPADGGPTQLNNCSRYYRDNKGTHTAYVRDICNWKDDCTPSKSTDNAKSEIGQAV